MIEERLLGFDVREPEMGREVLWEPARRDLFLLRLDVTRPLSVDVLVWPSLFDTGQGVGLAPDERRRLHLAGIPLPAFVGPEAGLWEDAARMRAYLGEHQADAPAGAAVAITWMSENGFAGAGEVGPYLARTVPATPDPGWQRLGFDVADGSLLSGLSNCGYSRPEAQAGRAAWGSRLNEHHLFGDPADAFAFGAAANVRVPEHAPFFVYGLYLMGDPR